MSQKNRRMSSSKPYLIRAMYDWLVDNKQTPYILINAMQPDVEVPVEYINDGKIVLNVSPIASQDLRLGNECVEFDARFGGIPMHVYAPASAILAIYSKENGRGMVFNEDEGWQDSSTPLGLTEKGDSFPFSKEQVSEVQERPKRPKGKPILKVIK